MSDKLSIIDTEWLPSLDTNRQDVLVSSLKGVLSAIPITGGMIAEAVSITIPNQRLDRVVETLQIFGEKIRHVEKGLLETKMQSEDFTDLLADVIRSSGTARTTERREYLASLLANSITMGDIDFLGQKKILAELDALNDIELLILKYHFSDEEEIKRLQGLHPEIFINYGPNENDSPDVVQRKTLIASYHRTLENRELTPTPEDQKNSLARILLKQIGLI